MKCQDAEQAMLLLESGELHEGLRAELETHLSACPACAGQRETARIITRTALQLLPAEGPNPLVLDRIRTVARRRNPIRLWLARGRATQFLAYAAALTLAIGGWLVFRGSDQPQSGGSAHAILALVTEVSPPGLTEGEIQHREQEFRSFGRQLLIMEGLLDEEIADAGGDESPATSPVEPSPTVLRWRNTGVCPS